MSQGKGRTPRTKPKRTCLSPIMQAEAERRAMKKATDEPIHRLDGKAMPLEMIMAVMNIFKEDVKNP